MAWTPQIWYERYQAFRPFSEAEAWAIFKLAAIGEAVGWTLLIIGIACEALPVSWNQAPVQIAGRLHGVLFLLYIVAVLLVAPSLQWKLLRTIVAGLCSVPPYGSLLYEQISSGHRAWHDFKTLQLFISYRMVVTMPKQLRQAAG